MLRLTGAHQHHLRVLRVNFVVHLDQVEFDDAAGMERLRRTIGGSCHDPAPSQIGLCLAIDALLGWHVPCAVSAERRVGVTTSSTLA